MLRRAALLALVAALTGCGAGEDRREAVSEYVEAANQAQETFRPAFEQAGEALREYGEQGPSEERAEELRAASSALRSARALLELVEPPPEARSLHADLLRLLQVQAGLALELSLASTYLPAAEEALLPAQAAGRRLTRALQDEETGSAQIRALRAYAQTLARSLDRLGRLAPPPVLRPWHEGEEGRLRATQRLALSLAAATEDGDREALDRALKAFEATAPDPRAIRAAQATAIRAFNRQVSEQERLVTEIARKQGELQELPGG